MSLYQFLSIHKFQDLLKYDLRAFIRLKNNQYPNDVCLLIYSCLYFDHWPEHVEHNSLVMLLS